MKVKIFSSPFNESKLTQKAESEINEWLESNPGIKVKFATHSETCEEANYWITILVWYEEKSPVQ